MIYVHRPVLSRFLFPGTVVYFYKYNNYGPVQFWLDLMWCFQWSLSLVAQIFIVISIFLMHKCHIIHVSRGEGCQKPVFCMHRCTEYRRYSTCKDIQSTEGKGREGNAGQHYKCIKMVNITCWRKLFSSIPANFSEVCRLFLMFNFDNCMRILNQAGNSNILSALFKKIVLKVE